MQLKLTTKKGDTLVESLFAFAIFGLVAIVVMQMMQRGARINQLALEINLAREQITAQAEALRLANNNYIAEYARDPSAASSNSSLLWNQIIAFKSDNINSLDSYVDVNNSCKPVSSVGAFVLNPMDYNNDDPIHQSHKIVAATVYPRLVYEGVPDTNSVLPDYLLSHSPLRQAEGIWIETKQGDDGARNYYDFAIRTCWKSTASFRPTTLETIVRLYVP